MDQTAYPISIIQKVDKKSVYPGGTVNYTITYRNNLAMEAEDVVVTDLLPEINYHTAKPLPTHSAGNTLVWVLGDLSPLETGSIALTVDLNEKWSEFIFKEDNSISGTGFVQVHRSASTTSGHQDMTFTNYVNITAYYNGTVEHSSDTSSIKLVNGIEPEIHISEHGSGTYYKDGKIEIDTDEGNSRTDDELSVSYDNLSFALPANRSISFNSKWSENVYNKDKLIDFSSHERYMYATNIDRQSRFKVADKESSVKFDATFEGAASVNMRVGPIESSMGSSGGTHNGGASDATLKWPDAYYESKEDYLGNFSLNEKLELEGDSSHKDIEALRAASGNGSVAVDKRARSSQRSYESGTGSYQVDDKIKTRENSVIKEIAVEKGTMNFTYTPNFNIRLNRSWEEGLISKSARISKGSRGTESHALSSLIDEEYSNIYYLKKSAETKGLNEIYTTSDFLGNAEFRAKISNPSKSMGQIIILQDYSGRYNLTRNIKIVGTPRYNRPHLSISKAGKVDLVNNTLVNYTIKVTNDGDSVLKRIDIQDFLPPGTSYLRSSLRPRTISSTYINWTVPVSLDVGESYNINLRLRITEKTDHLINQAYAYIIFDDLFMESKCISELALNWSESYPLPRPLIRMVALADDVDPMVIKYRIMLENYGKAALTANYFCILPRELEFLNSSVRPESNTSTAIGWTPIILKPRENRTIELWARASQNGTYISKSTIKAIGPKIPIVKEAIAVIRIGDHADVVGIQGENAEDNMPQVTDWQPPSCFSLNCSQETNSESDWYSCFDYDAYELVDFDLSDDL